MLNKYLKTDTTFDKDSSYALKGIAIILMMLHHNFRNPSLFSMYSISFAPFSENSVVAFSYACKICVSIFAFISGYGLYLAYDRHNSNATKWVFCRYIKTFSGYWFVWIASAIICQIIDRRTATILFKDGTALGALYSAIDFFGLHNLFSTPSINGTWWYMSAAAIFILLTPLLYRFKGNILLALIGSIAFIRVLHHGDCFTGENSVYAFLTPFILGSLFAEQKLFEKIGKIGDHSPFIKIYKAVAEIWIIMMCFILYPKIPMTSFWEFHFGLFPLAVIVFCVEYIIPLEPLNKILFFFGKHSMNVFLVHTFIRAFYLSDFTYSWGHFLLISLFLFSVSIGISIIIEQLKKVLKYNDLINSILVSWRLV